LLQIAERALNARVAGASYEPPELAPPWREPRAVFVTLRTPSGALRGCMGHLSPTTASLAREVAVTACAAGLDDPRFPAVTTGDLPGLEYEVSVLDPPEPCDASDLDPAVFGVIVTADRRRGVLLPAIDGVDTVERQIEIARRKAGIGRAERHTLQRFRVWKVA
jgi:AmmeMemoRadiSam system protein A